MMSLAEAQAKSVTRNRLVWLALALSLTLNIFVVAGLVWSQAAGPRPSSYPERLIEAGARLHLSPAQRDAFNHFSETILQRTKEMREANQPLYRRIWDELAKAQPDPAVLTQLVDEASETRHGYQKEVIGSLTTFLGTLSPEQRVEFVETVRHQFARDGQARR